MASALEVLFEDNHLLVVNKPAGLATMGVSEDEPSLWRVCREYIRRKYQKPGNVYLGVVSRVDRLVTGVVVFARTSKAASRLAEQFREGTVEKIYWALLERPPSPVAGCCEDWVWKNELRQRMEVVRKAREGSSGPQDSPVQGQFAQLSYQTLASDQGTTLVEVQLETGRKHQIRLQLGSRGWPVVGDQKYGAKTALKMGDNRGRSNSVQSSDAVSVRRIAAEGGRANAESIALHARRLRLQHPVRKELLEFVAPLPAAWGPRWQAWSNDQE